MDDTSNGNYPYPNKRELQAERIAEKLEALVVRENAKVAEALRNALQVVRSAASECRGAGFKDGYGSPHYDWKSVDDTICDMMPLVDDVSRKSLYHQACEVANQKANET